jgi:hypothetical protein
VRPPERGNPQSSLRIPGSNLDTMDQNHVSYH